MHGVRELTFNNDDISFLSKDVITEDNFKPIFPLKLTISNNVPSIFLDLQII